MKFLKLISAKIIAIIIGFAVLISPLNAHAEEELESKETGKIQAEEIKKETEEAIQKTANYTEEQLTEYRDKLDSLSADYLQQIEQLEKRMEVAGAETQAEISEQIDELDKKRKKIEQNLEQLQQSSQQAMGDIGSGIEKAIQGFKNSLERAKSRYSNP